jgi:hypothetical protein
MPNSRGATPQPHHLLRVLPIARTRDLGAGNITLISLEIYAEGFLVHTQMRHTRERADRTGHGGAGESSTWRRAEVASPEVIFQAGDDRGGTYGCWSSGGYGGGAAPDEMLWRRDYVFAPALNPAAAELRLIVTTIEWVRYGTGAPQPTVEESEPIDWTVAVPLA